jgi:predicted Kef-type K+ transport protein
MNFKPAKYGYLALGVSLAEILIIWGGTAIALSLPQHNWHWLRSAMMGAYSLALIASIGFAVAGLVRDARRVPAVAALVLTVVSAVICSVPIAY